jgi:hypothetical protein
MEIVNKVFILLNFGVLATVILYGYDLKNPTFRPTVIIKDKQIF